MAKTTPKVAIVTGASSGIGEATALRLQKQGFIVYAAARRIDRLEKLADSHPSIKALKLDLVDDASIQAAVAKVVAEQGRIDVLVNNAGYGSYGAIEDTTIEEAKRQFEVNVFGAVRLAQLVLPHMRKQRSGHIINITSIGGKIYTPLGGWYHATKHALEGLSDCLRLECEPFGISVAIIEPGSIATEWSGIAAKQVRETSGGSSAYAKQAEIVAKGMEDETNGKRASPPSVIADAIGKIVATKRPKTRYAVGFAAVPLIWLREHVSDRMFDWIIKKAVGF